MADKYLGGVKAGSTSVSVDVVIRKASDSTEVTGLLFNTAGNNCSYHRQGAARVAIALVTQTVAGAYASGGLVEVDATNQPGLYRLDIPDAALAAGVDYVTISFKSTNNFTFYERIPLSTATIQTGDSFARLGVPVNASISADIAATALTHADALIARNQQGGSNAAPTVGAALAGGLMNFSIAAGILTVKNGDGTTAYTRTLTRSQLDAIIGSV